MKDSLIGLYEKALPNGLTIREKLALAKKAGYDFLEISIDETDEKLARLDCSQEQLNGFLSDMRETDLPVYTMCLSAHRKYSLGSRDAAVRKRSLCIMQKAISFAAALGIRIIQLAGYDVYYEQGGADTQKLFYQNLKKCVQMAAGRGITLAFETMETSFMDTVNKALKAVKKIKSPYLQIYPDIGNVRNGAGENYLSDIKSGKGHIVAAHLKETVEGKYRDMFYGEGRVDFCGCIEELKKQGVRMFLCEFWYDGKTEPLCYIAKAYQFFEGKI